MEAPEERLVMVVDDDSAVRMLLRMILSRDGWTVLEAPDAEGALASTELPLDLRLLITDVLLPGLEGRELHRRLCERRPRLPVLFVSGDSREALIARGAIGEHDDFLPKPFTPRELAAKARAVAGVAPTA